MLALFIIAGTVSFQSIPISEALSEVMADSTSDINRIIDSRSYAEYYFYNTIPQVAEYSANNASYHQASKSGDIEWNNSNIDSYTDTITAVRDKWETETENIFNSQIEAASSDSCEIIAQDDREYSIEIYPGTSDFENVDDSSTLIEPDLTEYPMEASCSSDDGSTSYSESTDARPEVKVTSNRYMQLADESVHFMLDLESELNNVEPHSESKTACDATQWSSAESSAVSGLESNIQDAIDAVKADYPDRSGFELKNVNILTDSYTYDRGTVSEVVEGSTTETGPSDVGSCNCETCYETCYDDEGEPYDCNPYDCNCDDEYKVEVEAEPEQIELEWSFEDSDQTIIVEGNSENLNFHVNSYAHEFQ